MSWSICIIGKPKALLCALRKESERLTGASKTEFDAALPNMAGLLEENFGPHDSERLMRLSANGHGTFVNGEPVTRYCSFSMEPLNGSLVTDVEPEPAIPGAADEPTL